ncbi:aldo/keto reductase [Patescibacteria group bacterium]|nr:aldo/keto reductase [Patescibacteria group bacterium]
MEKRTLGNTGIEVTTICLGTMTWGQQNTEAEAHEQLDYAIDKRGINFIDTAEIYPIPPEPEKQGRTEAYIGTWINKRGKRDNLVIASKVSGRTQAGNIMHRDASAGLTRDSIRAAIEGSLTRLQTNYLDLYQVHVPDRRLNNFGVRAYDSDFGTDGAAIEETLAALDELVKEGKVRAIGVSNESPWGMSEYLRIAREKGYTRIASIQNQYSLLNRTYELGHSEFSFRENISLLAYSPLSMGVLSGKYLGGARPEGARHVLFKRNEDRYNPPRAQAAVEKYVSLAKEYEIDPSTFAIAFTVSRPFVTSSIIGATTMAQLAVDIDGGEVRFTEEMKQAVTAVYNEHPDPVA